jgi:Protein of unknown function (DUF2934)
MSDRNCNLPKREEIELRAYEIYLKRGGENGSALDDWLAAEAELSRSSQRDAPGPAVCLPSMKHAGASRPSQL